MNSLEREMRDLLIDGRERFGYVAVKAEFEAEGTRVEELLRLLDIAKQADVKAIVKTGGCEAVRDLIELKQLGVDYVIAPMIETPYALSKYTGAIDRVYNEDEREDVAFLFNLETIAAFREHKEIIALAASGGLDGVVFGRVDFCESCGLGREAINDETVTEQVLAVSRLCRNLGLELVVGGGVSRDSIPALQRVAGERLTRFETRKVAFAAEVLEEPDAATEGLLAAVRFELLWLKNKSEHYGILHREDLGRIEMLEARWGALQKAVA